VHSSGDGNNLISGSRLGGFVEGELNMNRRSTVEDLIPAEVCRPSKVLKQNNSMWDLPYEERKK
jgi:hypothetical protein